MSSLLANATGHEVPLSFLLLPSLTNTYGALLISTFLALALYGLTVNQTYRYYRLFGNSDITFHRLLVPAILVTDTFHSATIIHTCYHYLVENYFNPSALLVASWSIQFMPLSTGLVVLLCQSFYTRRIFLIDRRFRWIVAIIVVMMLAELGIFIGTTVSAFKVTTFEEFALAYMWLNSACFGAATIIDLVLMIVFLVVLRSSKTAFRSTKKGLDSLAVYAVIATLMITALTLPAMISTIVSKGTFVYLALAIPTTKIYTNGVLAFLNVRPDLAENSVPLRTMTSGVSTIKRTFGGSDGTGTSRSGEVSSAPVVDFRMLSASRDDSASGTDDGMGPDGPSAKTPAGVMGQHMVV
ncbi:hypothetical protein L226DRAFT_539929 [Lentinus tigrinus ALCF2SS1-7]|uniref:DUF6534 domain-containing protein n=1 Tax=Lentinus tigrinus ALCF2SS1-6 TaxID=1328759 RepID=A0A5C2RSQ7_9APHY|nr:hypothetical protein L227DRAFT_604146 [Lentinus tigrinus ALCF2SS1-6]RPD69252.1 hypothetical protein L226DRAFT_539929 [Lentinus tigrinus ALCF2SS1-7]